MSFLYKFKKICFLFFERLILLPNLTSSKINRNHVLIKNNEVRSLTNYLQNYFNDIHDKIIELINRSKNKDWYYFQEDGFPKEEILDQKSRLKINDFLSKKELIQQISKSFGYKVKFVNFVLRINFYNEKLPEEEGPKMWHRDNDALFGQLKSFLVINNLNEETGGKFQFIPQSKIPPWEKMISTFAKNDGFNNIDKNSRIKNMDVEHKYMVSDFDVISYGSKNDEMLIINSNDTYHKGGYLKTQYYRILIQAVYEPKYFSLINFQIIMRITYINFSQ